MRGVFLVYLGVFCVQLFAVEDESTHEPVTSEQKRLFPRLNTDRPELTVVRDALKQNETGVATTALISHFRNRFPKDAIRPKIINNVARDADEGVEWRFRSRSSEKYYKLHSEFEWNRRPQEVDDHHWLSLLVSLNILVFEADMYIRTNDEKYARACNEIFKDWLKHCPPGSGAPSWSLATAMMRTAVLLTTFERLVQWPNWPAEDAARMLNSIADHTEFLFKNRGRGNQDATNSEHLMRVAGFLPEFSNSSAWMNAGFERVKDRIFEDVLADGSQRELCSGYHLNAISSYTNALERARATGVEVSPEYLTRLEKMYEWCMVMMRPDGSVPTNGDSNGGNVREYLEKGAKLFKRDDMQFVATQGREGKPPTFTDGALREAGYYSLRSGWQSPDDMYFFMDVSRQPVVSHQYYDALHIDFYAYGRVFFPARGTFTYGGAYHRDAKATSNQSTITVDEKNQKDVPAVRNAQYSSPALSFLDGCHSGYDGISHRRQVLFVRPIDGATPYVLLIDRVDGKGSHTVDQNFYLPLCKVVTKSPACVETQFDEGANIRIQNLNISGLETQLLDSQMHPRQGQTVQRPGVRFRSVGELPQIFVTLLLPYVGAEAPECVAKLVNMGLSAEGQPVSVRIEFENHSDEIFVARDPVIAPKVNSKARALLQRATKVGTDFHHVP